MRQFFRQLAPVFASSAVVGACSQPSEEHTVRKTPLVAPNVEYAAKCWASLEVSDPGLLASAPPKGRDLVAFERDSSALVDYMKTASAGYKNYTTVTIDAMAKRAEASPSNNEFAKACIDKYLKERAP